MGGELAADRAGVPTADPVEPREGGHLVRRLLDARLGVLL